MEITDEKVAWVKSHLFEYESYWIMYQRYLKILQNKIEERARLDKTTKPEGIMRALDYAFYEGLLHFFGREFADKGITPVELQAIFKLLKDGNNAK